MFDIGFAELILIAVLGLIILGPERMPKAARTVGMWVGKFKRTFNQMAQEIDRELKAEEMREKLRQEGDELGLEKIQDTVKSALNEAKQFEHLTARDDAAPAEHSGPDKKTQE